MIRTIQHLSVDGGVSLLCGLQSWQCSLCICKSRVCCIINSSYGKPALMVTHVLSLRHCRQPKHTSPLCHINRTQLNMIFSIILLECSFIRLLNDSGISLYQHQWSKKQRTETPIRAKWKELVYLFITELVSSPMGTFYCSDLHHHSSEVVRLK